MFEKSRIIRFIGLVICSLSVNACATPSQVYWDAKVKELCEKDGGVTVYEKVELTKEEYERNDGKNGIIVVPSERSPLAKKYDYLWSSVETILHNENPRVRRMEYTTYRKSDGKILAKMITYARSGGDMVVIDAGTSFSCSDINATPFDVEKQVFVIKGE